MNCPKCGKEIRPGDKFCKGCGTRVESNETTQTNFAGAGNQEQEAVNRFEERSFTNAGRRMIETGNKGVNYILRMYFLGFSNIMWLSLIAWVAFSALGSGYGFVASICGFLKIIAAIVFIGALLCGICFAVTGVGQNYADTATQKTIAMLKERAFSKFNVDNEQISEVAPIVITGMGCEAIGINNGMPKRKIGKIFTKDPVEGSRVGNDGVARYLLIQTTVYAFTDTQLLLYSGNVDIATGMIYDESVTEIFYKDVNSVSQRDVLNKFKVGLFRNCYYAMKYLQLDVCGISHRASLDLRFAPGAEASLTGMESYIREKKN